jgi:hypothetical protein
VSLYFEHYQLVNIPGLEASIVGWAIRCKRVSKTSKTDSRTQVSTSRRTPSHSRKHKKLELNERVGTGAISLRDLNDWRALTVELLSRIDLGNTAKQDMDGFLHVQSHAIMQTVGLWAPSDTHQELGQNIFNILANAIQFSQLLRRQRACWYVRGPTARGRFDGDSTPQNSSQVFFDRTFMRDDDVDECDDLEVEGKARKSVELIICPGLFKRGNADGERFDTESCIVPQLVKCHDSQAMLSSKSH